MSAELVINWALHTGFDIAVLIALVLIFRRPFTKLFGAGAAYSLWLLPLIRLFLPDYSITLPRPSWMSVPPPPSLEAVSFVPGVAGQAPALSDPINWQIPVLTIWLAIAIGIVIYQLARQRNYMITLKDQSETPSDSVRRKIDKAADLLRLKRRPEVRLAATNIGPLVTGIVNPLIILPRNFEDEYDDRQQYFALTHEMAHIKRHDLSAAFLTLIFRALNWPNPLVHLAAVKFRTDQEAACDAYVLKTMGGSQSIKESYAETLIHSARLNRESPSMIEPTLANPLCLTIYHPLKERLMTMKTSKTRSTLLSRVGVAAFLGAGLAITAPITIASAQDEPKVEMKIKKVIKTVDNENGVETSKTYEIIEENGVTTVYDIDEHGNKTVVSEDEIGHLPMVNGDVEVMVLGDGDIGKRQIKIVGDKFLHDSDGTHSEIRVKRITKGDDGLSVDADQNVWVFSGEDAKGTHAAAMVTAAKNLLDQAETMNGGEELSSKVKRKLEKARKALEEAEAALAEE